MKQIIAIVKPFVAERVVLALRELPCQELIVREAKGFGRQKNYLQQYGESEYSLAFLPKVEILAWIDDSNVEGAVERIIQVSRTGRIGDGKILVIPLADDEGTAIPS